ncbi:MAG: DHH family phosphoesterase [Clostridia bacterium]|nr:DHH family phosphoesterase [Clostridia bacterium]
MSRRIDANAAAARLREAESILILTHRRPDGDTVGSAAALCRGLRQMGKQAFVFPNEDITPRLGFLLEGLWAEPGFVPGLICAVDIADTTLLTDGAKGFAGRVDLCLDHHPSNVGYARELALEEHAAAAGEVVWAVLRALDASFDLPIWEALYIAVSTDTGCFKFSNTTPLAHRIAADAIEAGVDFHAHNHVFFEAKSKNRFLIEKAMFDKMIFSADGQIACSWLDRPWLDAIGATDDDLDNLSTLTMALEGVACGIILTQNKKDPDYKVSVRTHKPADASRICQGFGGGGHPRAAGCTLSGPPEEAAKRLMAAAAAEIAAC